MQFTIIDHAHDKNNDNNQQNHDPVYVGIEEFASILGFGKSFTYQIANIEGFPYITKKTKKYIHKQLALKWIEDHRDLINSLNKKTN
jgi:hypothetical protein